MKIIDKNNLLKKNKNLFYSSKVASLEKLLEIIAQKLNLKEPEIIGINLDYDLEIKIIDNFLPTKTYTITLGNDLEDFILISDSTKKYIDAYKLTNRSNISHIKRIIESSDKETKIEKIYFVNEEKSFNLPSSKKKNVGFLYKFKNNNVNLEIDINIMENVPFVEGLFLKELLNNSNNIVSIENLYLLIKNILNSTNVTIEIKNQEEIIYYQNGRLMEYRVIKDNKKIEYRDGFTELLITRYEKETLENEDFQKILKNRSKYER